MRLCLALLLSLRLSVAASSPEPGILRNSGKPIQVPFQCQRDAVIALDLPCADEQPCPVFLDLSNIEQVGTRIFITGNIHTERATFESVLLMSSDQGKTWSEPHPRIPYAGLEGIQFTGYENGWIGGQILQTPPKDPFFLVTSDGGKSWRRQPVTEDSRVGAIDKFYFDSKTSGKMLVDRFQSAENGMRHEVYETQTGGGTWSLRQVDSKPIPWTAPNVGEKDWRVRPDAASKSFAVEVAEEGQWKTFASFLVSAGQCKPPEPVHIEPAEPGTSAEPAKPAQGTLDPETGVFRLPPSADQPAKKKTRK